MATINVLLTENARSYIQKRMASGAYETEDDVINEGLETLLDQAEMEDLASVEDDPGYQRWLVEVLGPRLERIKAGQVELIPAEEMLKRLTVRRAERRAARG